MEAMVYQAGTILEYNSDVREYEFESPVQAEDARNAQLAVHFRFFWFRMCFPDGKLVRKVVFQDQQVAEVVCLAYRDRLDEEDQFLCQARARCTREQYGARYLEAADNLAQVRAIDMLGYCTPYVSQHGPGTLMELPNAMDEEDLIAPLHVSPAVRRWERVLTPEEETLKATMTVAQARSLVVETGLLLGWTLGALEDRAPEEVDWLSKRYLGRNHELQVGALVLIQARSTQGQNEDQAPEENAS